MQSILTTSMPQWPIPSMFTQHAGAHRCFRAAIAKVSDMTVALPFMQAIQVSDFSPARHTVGMPKAGQCVWMHCVDALMGCVFVEGEAVSGQCCLRVSVRLHG